MGALKTIRNLIESKDRRGFANLIVIELNDLWPAKVTFVTLDYSLSLTRA